MERNGIKLFLYNIHQLPKTFATSLSRQGKIAGDRSRSKAIFGNFFLHIHSAQTHIRSLHFSTTLALGAVTAALCLILTVTGVLLMVHYKPSVGEAYASIQDIQTVVTANRLIRNAHRWAAHMMVLSMLFHMCRVFYAGAYKAPREFNWIVGMGLFMLTFALSFTGYLLPWDQLAYWAAIIGANIAGSPQEFTDALGITNAFDPGGFIRRLILGASEVQQETLTRIYLLHVVVLPIMMTVLLGVHFWRIRKDGGLARPDTTTLAGKGTSASKCSSIPSNAPRKSYGLMCVVRESAPTVNLNPAETVSSWPYLMRAELLVLMATTFVCLLFGVFFDAPLKEMANPAVPENPAKAPWYFLGLQEMVSYSAFMGGMVLPFIVGVGLSLIPYLDREQGLPGVYFSGLRGRRVALTSFIFGGVIAASAVGVQVKFGWLRDWFPNVPQILVILVNPATLLTAAYILWSFFVMRRTASTRMGAIAIFSCFVVGFFVLTLVGSEFRGPNWDFYWSRHSWPAH
jgi:quinol-cytochrome oxidoreductase complex cytochrome b subunit